MPFSFTHDTSSRISFSFVAKGFSRSISYPFFSRGIDVSTCCSSIVPLITASANLGTLESSSAESKQFSFGKPNISIAFFCRILSGSATPTIFNLSGSVRASFEYTKALWPAPTITAVIGWLRTKQTSLNILNGLYINLFVK